MPIAGSASPPCIEISHAAGALLVACGGYLLLLFLRFVSAPRADEARGHLCRPRLMSTAMDTVAMQRTAKPLGSGTLVVTR